MSDTPTISEKHRACIEEMRQGECINTIHAQGSTRKSEHILAKHFPDRQPEIDAITKQRDELCKLSEWQLEGGEKAAVALEKLQREKEELEGKIDELANLLGGSSLSVSHPDFVKSLASRIDGLVSAKNLYRDEKEELEKHIAWAQKQIKTDTETIANLQTDKLELERQVLGLRDAVSSLLRYLHIERDYPGFHQSGEFQNLNDKAKEALSGEPPSGWVRVDEAKAIKCVQSIFRELHLEASNEERTKALVESMARSLVEQLGGGK